MPMEERVTELLERWSNGDQDALDALIPLVDTELRQIAIAHFRRERADHTLQPTALVSEAYIRLLGHTRLKLNSRAHFLAVASRVMRRLLIDHARRHRAARRGGGDVMHTDAIHVADASPDPVDAIALDDAITKLTTLDARQGRVAELRCFAGMELEEIAEVLQVSVRTVKRDWATARLLLRSELGATAKVRTAAEGRA